MMKGDAKLTRLELAEELAEKHRRMRAIATERKFSLAKQEQ